MAISIKVDIEGIEGAKEVLKHLTREEIRKGLTDAAQILFISHKTGYDQRITPDGKKWADNPDWYQQMKGQSTPLTGPIGKKIFDGKYAKKYEFANPNVKRMKNALNSKLQSDNSIVIEYDSDVQERAAINQYGGESKMVLNSLTGGPSLEIDINVQARPHHGISDTYVRLGSKTDPEHILSVFESLIDKKLKGQI